MIETPVSDFPSGKACHFGQYQIVALECVPTTCAESLHEVDQQKSGERAMSTDLKCDVLTPRPCLLSLRVPSAE